MQEQPKNVRSITNGEMQLRKLWNVQKADFIYALFVGVVTETCEMENDVPNWDKIVTSETDFRAPQGYVGDEEWATRTAEHFGLEFPTEEYKED